MAASCVRLCAAPCEGEGDLLPLLPLLPPLVTWVENVTSIFSLYRSVRVIFCLASIDERMAFWNSEGSSTRVIWKASICA